MNAKKQTPITCHWCKQPAGRLHISVNSPACAVGEPHNFKFCGLLCLQKWVIDERQVYHMDAVYDLKDPAYYQ